MTTNKKKLTDQDLLDKYCIPSMGGYSEPGSHLCHILRRLDKNHRLNEEDKAWIKSKNMRQFHAFVMAWEKTGKPNFKSLRLRKEREQINRDVQRLSMKLGIHLYPDTPLHKRLQNILKARRFSERDVIWLHKKGYFKGGIKVIYHEKEAQHYLDVYKKDRSPWHLVNASSHFRKCHKSEKALKATEKLQVDKIKNKRLKSAICVTRGGACRDLHNFDEALEYAEKGYQFDRSSHHPCTLFGAIYYQTNQYDLGAKWYRKAEQNGAPLNDVDSEIRAIFKKMKGKQREEMKRHLLNIDPDRYKWVNKPHQKKKRKY